MSARPYLSPQQFSELVGIPLGTIRRWISRRAIPFIKMGRHVRLEPDVVIEHFNRKTCLRIVKPATPQPVRGSLKNGEHAGLASNKEG